MAAKTVITLNAGNFAYENEAVKVTGNLNVNEKVLNNINGQVMDGELNIGSFDAWRNGDQLSFNVHFNDPAVGAALTAAVSAAVEAVQAKL